MKMRIKILKDSQGNAIATSETEKDGSIGLEPKEQEGYRVEEANVEDNYKSDLGAFYKKGGKK
jgi:hypothetical protein